MVITATPVESGAPAEPPVPTSGLDDHELVRRVLARDPLAFELLMRRHNRRLYRIARSLLRDASDAEDALQEAYLSAYRAMAGFRGDASVATWLGRIVTNECMDRLRRGARRDKVVSILRGHELAAGEHEDEPHEPVPVEEGTPEQALARAQLRTLLERSIDQLPQDFRAVFVLRTVEELSVEETAASLDIPEATVRTRHFRARNLLRAAISRHLEEAGRDVFGFDGERCDRIVASVLARWEPAPA